MDLDVHGRVIFSSCLKRLYDYTIALYPDIPRNIGMK